MAWQNNWSAMQQQGMGPRYPPPMGNSAHSSTLSAPMPNYGASNTDQYNQWQWQQYEQQYAQWYAMYGEKYAQQTGNSLPPVASPMPQALPNAMANAYVPPAPPPAASSFVSLVAPPPPSEPHPDELHMNRIGEKPPLPEEKNSEEVAFDEQFRKWEQEFETWKKTNINHPDKVAYREYEQKYEEQRKKLLDHREQLRRRRLGQNAGTQASRSTPLVASPQKPPPPPPRASQPPPPPLPSSQPSHPPAPEETYSYGSNKETGYVTDENTQEDRDSMSNNMQSLFSGPGKSCRDGGIPGLDLIDDTPAPLPKKAKLEDPVIDLSNDEEDVKRSAPKPNPNNMISSLLNDPNVNALLQLVGKTMSGNSAGTSGATNPLVAALAQLTNSTNLANSTPEQNNSVEKPSNEMVEENVRQHSNVARSFGSHPNGPSDRGPHPSSNIAPHGRMEREDWVLGHNNRQGFDPRIPPPLIDVDFSRPPPMIRSANKSHRDRFDRNSEPASENGPYNDGNARNGPPLAKMPRFDLRPPLAAVNHKEYEVDPELGRPVAVPKPDWMSEDEYQEIYDRYEHVQVFEDRKSKMLLAIEVLRQKKIRTGVLVLDDLPVRNVGGLPKPMAPIKEPIKSEPVDDYFKPQQVFDYSNCSNSKSVTSHQLPAGRVIDYGHCGTNQQTSINHRFNNNRRNEFHDMDRAGNHSRRANENGFGINTQRFDYNHSRVANTAPVVTVQQSKQWSPTNQPATQDRTVSGLERLAQMHLNPNPEESNPNYPSKFLLMNDNRPNCLSTKRGKRPSSIRKQKLKQQQQLDEPQPEPASQNQSEPSANSTTDQPQVVCKQEPDLLLEDLSSDDDTLTDGGFAYQSNDESAKPIKQEPLDERSESTVSSLSSQNQTPSRMVDIDDLLLPPGRFHRPPRICLLIRGLPGSGKSYLARLIKNTEQRFDQSPRVLSIDDYFLVEREEEEKDPMTGKVTKLTKSEYEYDAEMEDIYVQNLIKAFKRTISERLFNFVIVDCCNHMLETYNEFHNYARSNGFKVYTCTMQTDVEDCARQNVHNRTEQEIQIYADNWAMAPDEHVQINFSSLFKPELPGDTDTTVADMDLAAVDEEHPDAEENRGQEEHVLSQTNPSQDDSNDSSPEGTAECAIFASKWDHDTSEQNLARLDGISKPLKRPPTLEDYLQLDDFNSEEHENANQQDAPSSSGGKKKRVRWADVEERKAQEKMRQLGFVVGVTDWKRMMDPSEGSSALTQTKYIARVKRQQ